MLFPCSGDSKRRMTRASKARQLAVPELADVGFLEEGLELGQEAWPAMWVERPIQELGEATA